jgi:anti-sigma B factor antagonist
VGPPGQLQIDTSSTGEKVIVRARGQLDAYSAPALRRVLGEIHEGRSDITIVLDLSQLTFVDAAGIGALLGAKRAIVAGGGRLILESPSPAIARVFHITRIDRMFTIRTTANT